MGLTDYSDMESEIADAKEPTVLPRGSEVLVRIIGVNSGVSDKNDCQWYQPLYEVPDDPMVVEFNDFMWELDKEKLTDKQYARSLRQFQEFAACFSLDYSRPFSWEDDLIGLTGWLIVGVKKDDEYGDKNTRSKYMVKK